MKINQTLLCLVTNACLASAWSPTNSYAPGPVECPAGPLVRDADGLSPREKTWIDERHKITDAALVDYISRAGLKDFDHEKFLSNVSLGIGMAFSGGGFRAMLSGAGQFSALDGRTPGANETGLGGIVQASSYITGLSGGAWFVGSLVMNNWTTVHDILEPGSGIWDLDYLLPTPGGLDALENSEFWLQISEDIEDRFDAGYPIDLTDPYGRVLAAHLFNMTLETTAGYTWSSIQDLDPFVNHEMPFPIVVADGRYSESAEINLNSTVFEFNPFELGSWDPSLEAFADVKYLGTNISQGAPIVSNSCVAGYDNAGLVLGTSSSIFNGISLLVNKIPFKGLLYDLVHNVWSNLGQDKIVTAVYKPNPFLNYNDKSSLTSSDSLFLVDGGEDDQNIPLAPLLQPERQVDTIFAFDNSGNIFNWPDGLAIISTYQRQFERLGRGIAFPPVPSISTYIAEGLNSKPVFFGCDAANLTDLATTPPLIIYIANRLYSYTSNTASGTLVYNELAKAGMVRNGFQTASRNDLLEDPEWPACVACAVIKREQDRRGEEPTEQCKKCFDEYCWRG